MLRLMIIIIEYLETTLFQSRYAKIDSNYHRLYRGTGMIASSSIFCPHLGRVIRDLFRLLDVVYGSTSLQQSSKGSCSLLVSGYNLRADCQWRTLVPPLNSGANAAPASVLALM